MFNLNANKILYNNNVIFILDFEKEIIRGKLINQIDSKVKKDFYEFYKNNLKEKNKEFIVSSREFSQVEEDFLKSLGFHFFESIYIDKEDIFIDSYRYVYKEVKIISDSALQDIIEKLDL